MTAIIGVLCDCNFEAQSGNIILSADKLITYSSEGIPVSSNNQGGKIYDLPNGFYAAIADDISRSHQIVSFLHTRMRRSNIEQNANSTVDLVKLALADTIDYVRVWIRREICADYGVSEDEFLHDDTLVERESIRAAIKAEIISTGLIVAGFSANKCPILFYTDCVGIQEQTNPGVFCGGSGSMAALNWLNFRGQNCFMSTQRTYFHVREAMHFAELSPVVGNTCATLLLQPGEPAVAIGEDRDRNLFPDWIKSFHLPDSTPLDSVERRQQFSVATGITIKNSSGKELS
jgi:hypothetical protein